MFNVLRRRNVPPGKTNSRIQQYPLKLRGRAHAFPPCSIETPFLHSLLNFRPGEALLVVNTDFCRTPVLPLDLHILPPKLLASLALRGHRNLVSMASMALAPVLINTQGRGLLGTLCLWKTSTHMWI
jgi:hypothetical protein